MIKLDFYRYELFSPEKNMEIDNLFLKKGKGFAFRLYGWEPPTVSIGVFQDPKKVCNTDYCKEKGISVIKRITGGGAVYHKRDITYMFSAPIDFFNEKTVLGVYREIGSVFLKIFEKLGIDCVFAGNVSREERKKGMASGAPCFLLPSDFEIIAGGKKIIGNALRMEKGRIMQHGSIAFDFDYDETAKVLNTEPEKLRERVCCVRDFNKKVSIEDFERVCMDVLFEYGFDINVKTAPFLFEN